MVRNGGWTQQGDGAVFTRLLGLYAASHRAFSDEMRLTYLEQDRSKSAWLPESEFASRFRAAVFVPDELSKYAPREYYAMGVPLFFVSQHLLVQLAVKQPFYQFDARYALGAHCGTRNASAATPVPFGIRPGRPGEAPDLRAAFFWTSFADLYHMPGVKTFRSFVGLLDGLVSLDADEVSGVQLAHMAEIREEVLPAFGDLLRSLLNS